MPTLHTHQARVSRLIHNRRMDHLPELPLLLADVPASLRQSLAQEGVPAAAVQSGRAGKFVLFDSRRSRPALIPGQLAIDIHFLRAGQSRDPLAALADERAACYEWQIGGLAVRETVARVHRASERRRLLADLRTRIEAAGGLWLRVSPYPRPYRSAFNFRLDHDDYHREDFDATLAAIAGYEHAVSHYVCAATYFRCPEAIDRLRGCHVGSHGWWHHTYRDSADNLANIGRGIDTLRAMGIDPVGFAAPHGRFNTGVLAALEQLGVTHSSEFGLAYDDLPFFPRESAVLQVPVHPICLGVCLEAARRMPGRRISDHEAAEIVLDHWRQVAVRKHAARQPMFFYGHPDGRLGRHSRLLKELLAHISHLAAVWCVTLAAFEQWWRQRAAIEISAVRTDHGIDVIARGLPAVHRAGLDYFRGNQVAQIDLDAPRQSVHVHALGWQPCHEPRTDDVPPVEKFQGLRAGLHRYLDWERATPIDEISVRTWRGWAKQTLRRVKA